MAAKYRLPIICLIDTPGAYPGIGAEERGQAYSIAVNLRELSQLPTPMVCVVIGEGGSGGALGIGMGDHVAILQFAYYSVISPEGCAGILWKDGKRAEQAARALKLTSSDLLRMQIVDEVIPEPLGGAHRDHRAMAATLKQSLERAVQRLSRHADPARLERRYQKFRRIGVFEELAIRRGEGWPSGEADHRPGRAVPAEPVEGTRLALSPVARPKKAPPATSDNVCYVQFDLEKVREKRPFPWRRTFRRLSVPKASRDSAKRLPFPPRTRLPWQTGESGGRTGRQIPNRALACVRAPRSRSLVAASSVRSEMPDLESCLRMRSFRLERSVVLGSASEFLSERSARQSRSTLRATSSGIP